MKYKYRVQVTNHDVDYSGNIKPSIIMRYMQEAGAKQLDSIHPNASEMRTELGYAFILSRANMSIYAPIHTYDELEIETWPCEGKGAVFTRCATVRRDSKLVAEMITRWALVDINTRRLIRHSEFVLPLATHEPIELENLRPTIPKDAPVSLVGERTVTYSQTDINRHMNNTCYADMFCDFLDMDKQMVVKFQISYINEAPMGETLKVYKQQDTSDCYRMRTVREDGSINAEVEITLDKI